WAPRCRLRRGGWNSSWSGRCPLATLPEVEGGKGTRLAQVVADEASDEAAMSGRVRGVQQRQIRSRVVQGDEIAVGTGRQAARGLRGGQAAARTERAAVRHAEEHGLVRCRGDRGAV